VIKAVMAGFLHASVTSSTWSWYATGWRVFKAFQQQAGQQFTWLLGKEVIQAFTGYCLIERKLKPLPVKTLSFKLSKT
jgi:hypothetical protein